MLGSGRALDRAHQCTVTDNLRPWDSYNMVMDSMGINQDLAVGPMAMANFNSHSISTDIHLFMAETSCSAFVGSESRRIST